MPIIAQALTTAAKRRQSNHDLATDYRTNYDAVAGWRRQYASVSGMPVSDAAALSLTAFYRGVALIAGTIAGLPFQVFEETVNPDGSEGPTKKLKTPETAYLWRRPNAEMGHQTLWERVIGDEVRGNGYLWVEPDAAGAGVGSIWYLDRNRVRPGRTTDGVKVYEIDGQVATVDWKAGGNMLHIPNWGGAISGYDPIRIAPQAIALGLSAEEYAAKAFSGGSIPPGILTSDQELDEEDSNRIRARWERNYGGANLGRIAVMSHGTTFQKISADMEAMQNLESRGFQLGEIERLLGLPPHLLADVDRSTSWGTGIEEQNRNLTTFNFGAHINRIQDAVSDDLLVRELTNRYLRLNQNGLLRGNTLQRFQAYKLADFMTLNEKRALEELPPIDGGDDVLLAPGTTSLDTLEQSAMAAPGPAAPAPAGRG